MQQRCSKYVTRRPRPHCHVAYQIKGNWAKGTMQAHILSLHSHSTVGLIIT